MAGKQQNDMPVLTDSDVGLGILTDADVGLDPKRSALQSEMANEELKRKFTQGLTEGLGFLESNVYEPLAHPLRTVERGIEGAISMAAGRPLQFTTRPTELMEQKFAQIPQIPQQQGLPAQIGAGVVNATTSFINGFLSPEGVALLGIGGIPKASQKLLLQAWGAEMAANAPGQMVSSVEKMQKGDWQGAAQDATTGVGGTLLAKQMWREHPPASMADALREQGLQEKADLTALNLSMPGTLRPQEQRMFAPPAPEPPAGMVVEPLPPKFSQLVGKGPTFFMEPPAAPAEVPLAPKVQRETRGKVSFGAEAPALATVALPERTVAALQAEKAAEAARAAERPPEPPPESGPAVTVEPAPKPPAPSPEAAPEPQPAAPAAQTEAPNAIQEREAAKVPVEVPPGDRGAVEQEVRQQTAAPEAAAVPQAPGAKARDVVLNPVVVEGWHGTQESGLKSFSLKQSQRREVSALGEGFYASPDEGYAKSFGQEVYKVQIKLSRPATVDKAQIAMAQARRERNPNAKTYTKQDASRARQILIEQGFDGVYEPENPLFGSDIVAFYPEKQVSKLPHSGTTKPVLVRDNARIATWEELNIGRTEIPSDIEGAEIKFSVFGDDPIDVNLYTIIVSRNTIKGEGKWRATLIGKGKPIVHTHDSSPSKLLSKNGIEELIGEALSESESEWNIEDAVYKISSSKIKRSTKPNSTTLAEQAPQGVTPPAEPSLLSTKKGESTTGTTETKSPTDVTAPISPTETPSGPVDIIDRLESMKIKDSGQMMSSVIPFLDPGTYRSIHNTGIDIAIASIRAGRVVKQAAAEAWRYIEHEIDKYGKKWNKSIARNEFEQSLIELDIKPNSRVVLSEQDFYGEAKSHREGQGQGVASQWVAGGRGEKEVVDARQSAASKSNAIPNEQSIVTIDEANRWLAQRGLLPSGSWIPREAVAKAIAHPDFSRLSIFDQVRVAAQLQRPFRENVYGDVLGRSDWANAKTKEPIVVGGETMRIRSGDTVRGCDQNCYDCYALGGANQQRINFQTPIRGTLEGTLHADEKLRIGTVGEPAKDWKWTNQQVKGLIERSQAAGHEVTPEKNVFFITKLLNLEGFDPRYARNLEVSMDPLYPEHMRQTMINVSRVIASHPEVNVVLRIRSMRSLSPDMQGSLEAAVEFARQFNLPVLETRMRFKSDYSLNILDADPAEYVKKGPQYKLRKPVLRDEVDKWAMCDEGGTGKCANCANCFKMMFQDREQNIADVQQSVRKEGLERAQFRGEPLSLETRRESPRTAREAAEGIASKLDELKAPTDRGTMNLFGVTNVLWNASIDVAKGVIRAGGSIADAIDAAVDHIKKNFKGSWDEGKARAAIGFSLSTGRTIPLPRPTTTSPATAGASTALEKVRNTLSTAAKTGDIRKTMAVMRDAGDNAAMQFAEQQGNDVRGQLRRTMGRGKTSMPLDEEALTFVREADGNRANLVAFRNQIASSTRADPKWKKRSLEAIDHGLMNWRELNDVANNEFKTRMDEQVESENANGVPTLRRAGYVPHVWDMPNEFGFFEGGGGSTTTGFKHKRTFATLAEGIAAGADPKSINAIELMKGRVSAGHRVINNKAWGDTLRSTIDPKTGNPIVTDLERIPRPGAPPDVRPPSGYENESVGGHPMAVLRGYAGIFSALNDPSLFSRNVGLRFLRSVAASGKHVALLMDTFHLGRVAFWESIIKPLSLTDPKIPLPSFKKGVLTIDYSPQELRRMAATGEIDAASLPQLLDASAKVKKLIDAGYNIGRISDAMYQDVLQNLPVIKQTTGRFNKFLFQLFQRGAMAEVGELEFGRYKRMYPTLSDRQIARMVANDLNTRFGNIGRQGWFKSKSAQDAARLIALAPQWNEGLIKSEYGALTGLGNGIVGSVKNRRLQMGVLPRAVGTMLIGQFAANQIINQVTRGQFTWDNEEEGIGSKLSAWIPDKIGGGPGFFLHPAGLAAEITHLLTKKYEDTEDVRRTLKSFLGSRSSTIMRPIATYLMGETPFGKKIRPEEIVKETGKAAIPWPIPTMPAFGAVKELATGEPYEEYAGQFQRQLMSTGGVKVDQAKSPRQRLNELAKKWKAANGIKDMAEFYEGDYTKLTRALEIGNKIEAGKEFKKLKESKTTDAMIDHFLGYPLRGVTGAGEVNELKFRSTLTPVQQKVYEAAIAEKSKVTKRFFDMLRAEQAAGK